MKEKHVTALVWGVFFSGFLVWLLPIPRHLAHEWSGIVAALVGLAVFAIIAGLLWEAGIEFIIGIALVGGVVVVVSKVYERAGVWFVALVGIVVAGLYFHKKSKEAASQSSRANVPEQQQSENKWND